MRTVHGSEIHNCIDCSYSTNNKSSLKTHREAVHLKIKHKCKKCDFQASLKVSVNDHVKRVHLQEKFYCDFCDFSTSWKRTLKLHAMSVHERVTEACKICNKIGSKSGMKQHMNLYHKEKVQLKKCVPSDLNTQKKKKT